MKYSDLAKQAAAGSKTALSDLKRIADSDPADPEVLFVLGYLFDNPTKGCLHSDLKAARQYYLKAALLGHPLSQLSIGNMLDYGEGGERDMLEARRWYLVAAKQGVRDAQMHFARMLEMGRGGVQDREEAAVWYMRAVEQGDEHAATNLASMLLRGELRNTDNNLILALLQFASDKLDGVAHLQLADIHLEGRIVERHPGISLLHYCIAALLLPPNSNRDMAIKNKELLIKQNPEAKGDFESKALAFISERNGRLPS